MDERNGTESGAATELTTQQRKILDNLRKNVKTRGICRFYVNHGITWND
jgi:hypothetical protein